MCKILTRLHTLLIIVDASDQVYFEVLVCCNAGPKTKYLLTIGLAVLKVRRGLLNRGLLSTQM